MTAKKFLKLLHTLGAVGLTGALVVHLMVLGWIPEADDLGEQAVLRQVIATVAAWLLLPALGLVLVSGLLALAVHPPFREARWVWLKAVLGLSVFEGTLVAIQGPAVRNAELTLRALSGELEVTRLPAALHDETGALWLVLGIALVNIVVAVWRPALRRPASTGRS